MHVYGSRFSWGECIVLVNACLPAKTSKKSKQVPGEEATPSGPSNQPRSRTWDDETLGHILCWISAWDFIWYVNQICSCFKAQTIAISTCTRQIIWYSIMHIGNHNSYQSWPWVLVHVEGWSKEYSPWLTFHQLWESGWLSKMLPSAKMGVHHVQFVCNCFHGISFEITSHEVPIKSEPVWTC